MRRKYLGLSLILVCCFHETTYAAEDFSSYVQLRYRYEYDDNFSIKFYGEHPKKGEADDGFLLQRLRAGFIYNFSDNVMLSVGVQDSRVYGQGLPEGTFDNAALGHPHDPFEDYTEPYNAYVQLKHVFGSDVDVKIGRQIIKYGNNRIFGPGEWGNSGGYAWDAAVVSYKRGKDFVDLFWGAHIIHDPDIISWGHRHYFNGGGTYTHFEFTPAVVIEPFLIFKYDTHETFLGESGSAGDFFSVFPGTRITGDLSRGFFYDVSYVWQSGTYGADDVEAWGAHGHFGKKFPNLAFKPCPSVEYSYATGDGAPNDGVRETFEGVFGGRDRMFGRMNLFDWNNLKDLKFNLDVDPLSTVHVKAEFHKFWLDEEKDGWSLNPKLYRDKTGMSGDDVGDEFDIVMTWKPEELFPKKYGAIELQVGYSHFWRGGFTDKIADDCDANWYFSQVTYSLKF
jgi:hypothetical protein